MKNSIKVLSLFWKQVEKSDNVRIASQEPEPGVAVVSDIPYIEDGEKRHLLDVYYPEKRAGEKLPILIDIHGGGWMYGYKEINKYYCMYLASLGFTVFSINYSLVPEYCAKDQIQDVFAAFNWIDRHASEYPCDTDTYFLTGDSAGAHIGSIACAAMGRKDVAENYEVKLPSFSFRAVGFVSGAFFTPVMLYNLPVTLFKDYGRVIFGEKEIESGSYIFEAGSGIYYDCDFPPCYLISSDEDFVGRDTKEFCDLLTQLGVKNTVLWIPKGKEHKLEHVFSVVNPHWSESIYVTKSMVEFFFEHCK